MADKLYLYDTATGSALAKTETPLRSFEVQAIDKGYILSGMGDDGMMAYIYDSALTLTKKIAVDHLLTEDFVVSETGAAASTDGKKLAIATLNGLYLYDLEKEKLTTLLDLTKKAGTSKIQISVLGCEGERVFVAGFPVKPEQSAIVLGKDLREEQAICSALHFFNAVGGRLGDFQIAAIQGKASID